MADRQVARTPPEPGHVQWRGFRNFGSLQRVVSDVPAEGMRAGGDQRVMQSEVLRRAFKPERAGAVAARSQQSRLRQ